MKSTTLTPKQQRFAAEYTLSLNATQAAIAAGYSPRTAQPAASRLLSNVMVSGEIARLKGEQLAATGLSANRILEELGGIQETLIVYPRRQGQRQHTTATCLTRMSPLQSRLFSLLDLKRYAPPSP